MDYESIARELESLADKISGGRALNNSSRVFMSGQAEGIRIAAQTVRDIAARRAECRSVDGES